MPPGTSWITGGVKGQKTDRSGWKRKCDHSIGTCANVRGAPTGSTHLKHFNSITFSRDTSVARIVSQNGNNQDVNWRTTRIKHVSLPSVHLVHTYLDKRNIGTL